MAVPARTFDACVMQPGQADKYQTVRFDGNSYSVPRRWAFRVVTVKGYVDRVEIVADGRGRFSSVSTRLRSKTAWRGGLTAERVLRKDRYGPLVRSMEAADAAHKADTMSEDEYDAEFEKYHQEMEALENEVFLIASDRFVRNFLDLAYGDPDLNSIPLETREAFLVEFKRAMGDLVLRHVGIDPEADGPYE